MARVTAGARKCNTGSSLRGSCAVRTMPFYCLRVGLEAAGAAGPGVAVFRGGDVISPWRWYAGAAAPFRFSFSPPPAFPAIMASRAFFTPHPFVVSCLLPAGREKRPPDPTGGLASCVCDEPSFRQREGGSSDREMKNERGEGEGREVPVCTRPGMMWRYYVPDAGVCSFHLMARRRVMRRTREILRTFFL